MKLSEIMKKSQKGYSAYNRTTIKHKRAAEKPYKKPVELTAEQRKALVILESGKNVFLSGEAGTGKSFVLNEFVRRASEKNVIVCAPTGIAAINVGGSTLHRVFDIPIRPLRPEEYNTKPSETLIKADIIIIDEISMCRFDVFEYVIKTIRKAEELHQAILNEKAMSKGEIPELLNKKQIIVVGDFYQLPPVIMPKDKDFLELYWGDEIVKEGFPFQSRSWKELDFQNIILKEVIRQKESQEFISNLNMIRKGDVAGIIWFNQNASKIPMDNSIYLCATNRKADAINREKSEELVGEVVKYNAQISGQVQESDKLTSDELELKVGMQVMTLVNNHEEGYKNGSVGKIVSLEKDLVKIQLNTGASVDVRFYNWEIYGYEIQEEKVVKVVLGNYKQIPIKIAYAITIHKAQGQTYSSANISPDCFAAGQLYVALSRIQNIEKMSLEHDIRNRALIVSEAVKQFYLDLEEVSEEYVLNELQKCIDETSSTAYEQDELKKEIENQTVVEKKSSVYKKVQNMTEEEVNSCYMYKTIKGKPNAYAPWTDKEESEMLQELDSGMTIEDIAKKHCRTIGSIRSRLNKMQGGVDTLSINKAISYKTPALWQRKTFKSNAIKIGDVITVLDIEENEELTYRISESKYTVEKERNGNGITTKSLYSDSAIKPRTISIDAPLVQAAYGVKVGDEFEVKVGEYVTKYKLLG